MALRDHGVDVNVLQLAQWSPPWPLSQVDRAWRDGRANRRDMMDKVDGIPVHHPLVITPRPSRVFPGDPWDREVNALVKYCRSVSLHQADAVIGHFMVPDGYHALGLGSALGIPSAAVAWGDDVHAWPSARPYWRERLRQVLTHVDLPIACSQRLALDANEWLEEGRKDWRVVYGGVDHRRFHPPLDRSVARETSRLPPDLHGNHLRLMLSLGQPVRAKGYIELLDAWAGLASDLGEWRLVMGGAAWGDLDMQTEIRTRGLDKSAFWIGPQPAESIPQLLQACDAFVLASHNEGLSLSVLEAMATGLPTITTDVGGHAEVITDDSEGWLIPARDSQALAHAIRELVTSHEERSRRAAGGRRAAVRIGSPFDNTARLITHLRDITATKSRRPIR